MTKGHPGPPIRAILSGKPGVTGQPVEVARSPRIAALLSKPTWSVRSLLPKSSDTLIAKNTVTKEKLHHLLRLSALPPPKNAAEESHLLQTLQAQLHFVKEIQKVNTAGVEPLRAIRDETVDAIKEETIELEDLQEHLNLEEKVGRNGRIRRRKDAEGQANMAEKWNPFSMSEGESKRVGKYFVVRREKKDKDTATNPQLQKT